MALNHEKRLGRVWLCPQPLPSACASAGRQGGLAPCWLLVPIFSVLRNFHNGWTHLHSHQQYMSSPFSAPSQVFIIVFYFIFAVLRIEPRALHRLSKCSDTVISPTCYCLFIMDILIRVRWFLSVVLICISLMIISTEHFSYAYWLFIYLFLRNFYSDSCPFLIKLIFFLLACFSLWYILDSNILSYKYFERLSPIILLIVSFVV